MQVSTWREILDTLCVCVCVCVCVVLGFELRAYTLSHSHSPFFVIFFFKIGSLEPSVSFEP
jgi:hypothetical protein